jgi:DNA-directed RNA polymerase subunit beta'
LSFAKDDIRVPVSKAKILGETQKEIDKVEKSFQKGVITEGERYLKIIDLWTHARERVGEDLMQVLREDQREDIGYVNPIFCMVSSGARGSIDQIRQLGGMRGLMAKPSGKIIETPIKANFREGLKVLEYFSSTHGARKGLADTALKTADAGYLTRKLTDVAQNVVITVEDCRTPNGVTKGVVYKGEKVSVTLAQAVRGRTARDAIVDSVNDEIVVREGEMITEDTARRIEELGYERIRVRSPLTCEAGFGVCSRCYGMDLSRGSLAERGLAVGIIAAQSIGEPGTQLTMRTFHIGGTASRAIEASEVKAKRPGTVNFLNLKVVKNAAGQNVVLNRNGELRLVDLRGREIDRYAVPTGATVFVGEGDEVKPGQPLCQWDPHHVPILAEFKGKVRYEDLIEGKTLKIERDARRGAVRKQVIEHKGDLHPQIVLEDREGQPLALYPIPERAYIEVDEGVSVGPGELLAKTARDIQGTQDITGGLPRVTELFEARRPKDPAVISEIEGVVELGEKKRGKRTIVVRALGAKGEVIEEKEHSVSQGKHLRVHKGDEVRAGEPLVDGPLDPHDILAISGEEEVQGYLLREIQGVYRSQGVTIDDKHIELILAQMMRKVQVKEPGDSEFLPGAVVEKFRFKKENERLRKEKKKPATGETLLLGVTKASLSSESFISAASFQETTKVLTEAAIAGRRDYLVGLKENVILGHLVPTGTGFRDHNRTRVKKNIDFGEIGTTAFTSRGQDADLEALVAGLDPAAAQGGLLAAVGAEGLSREVEEGKAAKSAGGRRSLSAAALTDTILLDDDEEEEDEVEESESEEGEETAKASDEAGAAGLGFGSSDLDDDADDDSDDDSDDDESDADEDSDQEEEDEEAEGDESEDDDDDDDGEEPLEE